VVLVLQCYIRYSDTGIYCKTTHTNFTKYGLMCAQSESVKNFLKLFTETGVLQLVHTADTDKTRLVQVFSNPQYI